ncbi:MAG: GNAT family N-acetyltransferase [Thermoleophilia bacterium]|nr:GNAT family N-acetyltransferase [Thermoleophilia bacterium]
MGEEEAILPLYDWLFADPGTRPSGWEPGWATAALVTALEGHETAVLVAQMGGQGRFLGFCTAYIDLPSVRYGTRCWVEDLAVDPGHRSSGIGKLLLDRAESWAAGLGATHLELATGAARVDSQRFYESRNPSEKSVIYRWRLDPRGS